MAAGVGRDRLEAGKPFWGGARWSPGLQTRGGDCGGDFSDGGGCGGEGCDGDNCGGDESDECVYGQ